MDKFLPNKSLIKFTIVLIMVVTGHLAFGQSKYNPSQLFPALPLLPPGNEYRTATGEPGPSYW